MFLSESEKKADDFWREYEEKTGEKILARGLGRYISGWEEFDCRQWTSLWGLIVATSGGFRFHHFPQKNWFDALTHSAGSDAPKEKTIFIHGEKIFFAQLLEEHKWWKKIFSFSSPQLVINYLDETGKEKKLLLEADRIQGDLAGRLNEISPDGT